MKKGKAFKAVILGIIVVFLVCTVGYILKEIFVADTQEILIDILTKPENVSLNTINQKNRYSYYQIVDGILYLDGEDGFCQYDFSKKEWKTIWSGEVNNYKVVGRNVFCMEPADDSEELWNVLSRDLDNFTEKKVLIEKVFDCIFCDGCIYYSCFDENHEKRYIYQFDTNTSKSKTIFCIDSQVDDEIVYGEMVAASENYFLFCENGGVWIYNRKTSQWNRFGMDFNEPNLYFWIHDIQINQTDLYIQGLVCNTEKSGVAGYYVEEDAAENGIWRVNLETGSKKQVVNEIYYGGIYILGDVLYAVDDGKYDTIKISYSYSVDYDEYKEEKWGNFKIYIPKVNGIDNQNLEAAINGELKKEAVTWLKNDIYFSTGYQPKKPRVWCQTNRILSIELPYRNDSGRFTSFVNHFINIDILNGKKLSFKTLITNQKKLITLLRDGKTLCSYGPIYDLDQKESDSYLRKRMKEMSDGDLNRILKQCMLPQEDFALYDEGIGDATVENRANFFVTEDALVIMFVESRYCYYVALKFERLEKEGIINNQYVDSDKINYA